MGGGVAAWHGDMRHLTGTARIEFADSEVVSELDFSGRNAKRRKSQLQPNRD